MSGTLRLIGAFLSLVITACTDDVEPVLYQRCTPELLSVSPGAGLEGQRVELTGRHVIAYDAEDIDPRLDVLVRFGADEAVIADVEGPIDIDTTDEDGVVDDCDACATCVTEADQGCVGCAEACHSCVSRVTVTTPMGFGDVAVVLINAMGTTQAVPFSYQRVEAEPSVTPTR